MQFAERLVDAVGERRAVAAPAVGGGLTDTEERPGSAGEAGVLGRREPNVAVAATAGMTRRTGETAVEAQGRRVEEDFATADGVHGRAAERDVFDDVGAARADGDECQRVGQRVA